MSGKKGREERLKKEQPEAIQKNNIRASENRKEPIRMRSGG